ncbi:UNVERIFIED_CONTAM: hypothetical protein RMT77_016823 [Armadillidium vulgare]
MTATCVEKTIAELNEEATNLGFYGVRHTLALMCFLGWTSIFAARVSLSVAIVAMVNNTKEYETEIDLIDVDSYPLPSFDTTEVYKQSNGEFNWSDTTKGHILGSYYYGYVLTNIIGGRAAEKWGGRLVAGSSMLATSFLTILSPFAAAISSTVLIVLLFMQGIVGGICLPAINSLIAKWYPKNERSKFGAFIFSASQMGTVVSMGISGWLCGSEELGGWSSSFYFFGSCTLICGISFFLLVRETPGIHPRISDAELKYIVKGCPPITESIPVPWLSIFSSKYFWSIVIGQFGVTWSTLTLLTELPTYFDEIVHLRIKDNGLLSALPFLGMWIFTIVLSNGLNSMVQKNVISLLTMRRISIIIAGYIPAAGIISLIFIKYDDASALAIFIVIGTALAGSNTSVYNSHIDISPRFAGTTLGLATTVGCSSGFISPAVTSYITNGNHTKEAWNIIFIIYAVISVVSTTIYTIFLTTDIQPWNEPKIDSNKKNSNSKENPCVLLKMSCKVAT